MGADIGRGTGQECYAPSTWFSASSPSNFWMSTCGICSIPVAADSSRPSEVPDFSGEWVCTACDGDIDAYLAEMGAGLMARLGARVRRYDVGTLVKVFTQNGNDLDIDIRGPRKFTQMLRVGGGQQVCEEEDGAVLVEPIWERRGKEGDVLCLEVSQQDGSKPRTVRHWISQTPSGDELTIEFTTQTACCVKWRYRRRNPKGQRPLLQMLNPPPPPRAELTRNGKPDFSGKWMSYTCKGDVEGFFEEMGVGKAGRTAMSAMNFGVGLVEKVIVQAGDNLQITDAWPTGPTTQKFTVGAGEQVTVGTQGKELYVSPVWEHGHVLRVATQPMDRSETPNGPMRYYFDGDELVVMYESLSGRTVQYLYRRSK